MPTGSFGECVQCIRLATDDTLVALVPYTVVIMVRAHFIQGEPDEVVVYEVRHIPGEVRKQFNYRLMTHTIF